MSGEIRDDRKAAACSRSRTRLHAPTGDEVVQLYVHDPVASIVQPVRRLHGFTRVTPAAGAARTVRFTLTPSDVGFYDADARFVVERGTVEVYVGTSPDDTPLTTEIEVG